MQEIQEVFQRLQSEFIAFLPKILMSLVVLCIGYFIARLVKYIVIRLFQYFDKITKKRFSKVNFEGAGSFLGIAFFWLVLFFSIVLITEILALSILTQWFQSILQYIPNIFAATLIIFAAIILGNLLSNLIESVSERTGFRESTLFSRIIRFALLSLAVIIALDQIGVQISLLINIIDIVLAALLFGAALAFALGARTSVSNILAGYYVRKGYKVGDEIQIGDTKGKITKINSNNVVLENEIGRLTIPAKEFNETKSYLIKRE